MSKLLIEIIDNYIDDRMDNETLLSTLNELDDKQLQIVKDRINEVKKKYGDCKLQRVTLAFEMLSIKTDHKNDVGVTVDLKPYSIK